MLNIEQSSGNPVLKNLTFYFCFTGVASLLSFRLFLLNVADTIPRTSDHVPLLGKKFLTLR